MVITWTDRHEDHAKAALLRLAAKAVARGAHVDARAILLTTARAEATATIGAFVAALALHLDARANAESILRRVCIRAEGREVVDPPEVFWRVRLPDGRALLSLLDLTGEAEIFRDKARAFEAARNDGRGGRVYRVTLTRRRILKAKKGEG